MLGAAAGIAMYWPVVVLASTIAARDAPGWNLANETAYWIVLPIVSLWGAFGPWRVAFR